MPELPEVETMRRGIAGVVGGRITDVAKVRSPRRPIEVTPGIATFRRRVCGARIDKLTRVGKRVAIWTDRGDAIVIEPRMTGLVLLADPPTTEHLRWQLELAGRPPQSLLYWDRRGLGSVRLFSERKFHERFGPDVLGPDALTVSAEDLQQRLGRSRRAIKVALLDQRAVAGIGNLYAAEILHVAGIDPRRRCSATTRRQWEAVALATHTVLAEAIRYEGSTLSDGTYRNALNKAGGYQNRHRVYDKAGATCDRCQAAPIRRIVQAQRSTFFCPQCQTRTGANL